MRVVLLEERFAVCLECEIIQSSLFSTELKKYNILSLSLDNSLATDLILLNLFLYSSHSFIRFSKTAISDLILEMEISDLWRNILIKNILIANLLLDKCQALE